MNKPIIFEGPYGSGKTWISIAIAELMGLKPYMLHYKQITEAILATEELLIIDGCKDLATILLVYKQAISKRKELKLIFCTQHEIEEDNRFSIRKCCFIHPSRTLT